MPAIRMKFIFNRALNGNKSILIREAAKKILNVSAIKRGQRTFFQTAYKLEEGGVKKIVFLWLP